MKTIKIEDVAKIYQDLLGHNYDVNVNNILEFSKNKIPVCVYPTRRPYKVKGINSEVLEIYIEVYIPITERLNQDNILNHINQTINGLQEGEFESGGETWSFYSTLDFTRPLMPPQIDSGSFNQLLSLQGNILVSASDGAMLLNDIEQTLTITEGETITTGELRVLRDDLNVENSPEQIFLCNEKMGGAYNKTQMSGKTITILLMNDPLCKRLVMAMEKIKPFDINQIFEIETKFKKWNESYTLKYVLTNLSRSSSAGAFSQISLTLLPISSILEAGDEDE